VAIRKLTKLLHDRRAGALFSLLHDKPAQFNDIIQQKITRDGKIELNVSVFVPDKHLEFFDLRAGQEGLRDGPPRPAGRDAPANPACRIGARSPAGSG
jgi:hypothetical protein